MNPESSASSNEPPIRRMGRVISTAKERGRAALRLLAELDEKDTYRTPGILKRYETDVIEIAQRGELFAQHVIKTGSFNKAKSGVRHYQRLLGGQGNRIGELSRHRFYAAVKKYEEKSEAQQTKR